MHDYAHRFTDKEIAALEKEVAAVYKQATAEAEEKLNDYLKRFATKDKIWAAKVANGERTAAEYAQWRKGQLIVGERWKTLSEKLAEEFHKSNMIARDIALGHRAAVYAENFNFATYGIEKAAKVNTSFTVYSRESVERIVRDQPELLPPPGKRMKKKLKNNPDIAWQKGQIQSVTMQAIVQGESIPGMARRIAQTMGEQNHGSTIRYARTAMTGAQNAGRIDAYKRAESLGIDIEQQWVATLDGRTRFEHRQLDGQTAKVGEPFKVDGYKIMFPGDPTADAEMIWNCRCTTIAVVNGISHDLSRRAMDESLGDMSYSEWKENHNAISHRITKQEEIGEAMRRRYIREDYGGGGSSNSSGGGQPEPIATYSPMGELSETPYKYEYDDTMYSERQKDHAMQFARRIQTLQEDYPMPDGRALYIGDYHDVQHRLSPTQRARAQSVMDDGSFAVAQCWINPENDTIIGFNPSFTLGGSFADDVAFRNRKIAAGEIIENLYYSPEGVAIHEYGHALADYVTNAMIYDDPDAIGFWEWYKSLSKEDIAKGLSEYAATNKDEFMAEAFAELMMPNPRTLARQYGEYLAKCMESNYKIDEGFTGKGNPVKSRFWESLMQNGGG